MPAVTKITSKDELPLIDAEFEAYLPLLSDEDSAELEALIVAAGEADPLVVWAEPNLLVDGYRRLKILRKHKLPVSVVYKDFPDREAALKWMVRHQLARRNFTDQQRAYYVGKLYEAETAKGADLAPQGKDNAAAKVSKSTKTSSRTVKRAGQFAKAVDAAEAAEPGAKKNILAGKAGSMEKIIKTAPKRCPRCTRVMQSGSVPNCPACAELNKARTERTATAKRPKSGTVLTDWRLLEKCIGQLARSFEAVFQSLGMSRANRDYSEANGAMNTFVRVIERVKKAQK